MASTTTGGQGGCSPLWSWRGGGSRRQCAHAADPRVPRGATSTRLRLPHSLQALPDGPQGRLVLKAPSTCSTSTTRSYPERCCPYARARSVIPVAVSVVAICRASTPTRRRRGYRAAAVLRTASHARRHRAGWTARQVHRRQFLGRWHRRTVRIYKQAVAEFTPGSRAGRASIKQANPAGASATTATASPLRLRWRSSTRLGLHRAGAAGWSARKRGCGKTGGAWAAYRIRSRPAVLVSTIR